MLTIPEGAIFIMTSTCPVNFITRKSQYCHIFSYQTWDFDW
jgi:hypothetical protein